MIEKKIAQLRAKRKKAKAEIKKLIKSLGPVIEKAIKAYVAQKYGVKL